MAFEILSFVKKLVKFGLFTQQTHFHKIRLRSSFSGTAMALHFNKKPTKLKTVPLVLYLPNSCNSHHNLANLRQGRNFTEAALGKLGCNHEA